MNYYTLIDADLQELVNERHVDYVAEALAEAANAKPAMNALQYYEARQQSFTAFEHNRLSMCCPFSRILCNGASPIHHVTARFA
jgi:hypothetical protein